MNVTKFTKGKWVVNDFGAAVYCDLANSQNVFICNTIPDHRDRGNEDWRANAQLISAAPRLYAFVKRKAESGDLEAQNIIKTVF